VSNHRPSGYVVVDDAQGIARLIEKLRGSVRLGMDIEADSLHHYAEKACLIQASFSGGNYIVDPLAGFSLSEFLELVAEKQIIFHGADYDLRVLKKSFGFRPKAPVFDTMLAAQVLGDEKVGLAAQAERYFGKSGTLRVGTVLARSWVQVCPSAERPQVCRCGTERPQVWLRFLDLKYKLLLIKMHFF